MPDANPSRKPSKAPVVFIVIGSIFSLGVVWGLIGTIFGMTRAFNAMGAEGMGQPEALAEDIGIALYTTAIGFIMTPIGIVFLGIGIWWMIRQRKQLAEDG